MNTLSRTITGTITIILGLVLIAISIFKSLWVLIYGIPILIIGIFILLNKKEDYIETIKTKTKGGKK